MLNQFIDKFCELKRTDADKMDEFFLEMDSLDHVQLLKAKNGVSFSICFDGMLFVTFLDFEIIGESAYIYVRPKEMLNATDSLYPSLLLDYLYFLNEYRTDDMSAPIETRDFCYLDPAIICAEPIIANYIKRAVYLLTAL